MALDVDGERSKLWVSMGKKLLQKCRLVGLDRMAQIVRGFRIEARTEPADAVRIRAPIGVAVLRVSPDDGRVYGHSIDSLESPAHPSRRWERCAARDSQGQCTQKIDVDVGGDTSFVRPALVAQSGEMLQMLHAGGGRDRSGERDGLYRHNNPLYNYPTHCWSPHGAPVETPAATERDPSSDDENVFVDPDVSTAAAAVFVGQGTSDIVARVAPPNTDWDHAAVQDIGMLEPVQSLVEIHRRKFESVDGRLMRTGEFEFPQFLPRAAYTVDRVWDTDGADIYFDYASWDLLRAQAFALVVPQTRDEVRQGEDPEIRVLTAAYHTTPSLPTTDGPWLHPSTRVSLMSVTGTQINWIEYKTPLQWSSVPSAVPEDDWDGLYVPYPGTPLLDWTSSWLSYLMGYPYANAFNKVTFYDPAIDDFITWGKLDAGSSYAPADTVGTYAFGEDLTALRTDGAYDLLSVPDQMVARGTAGYTFPAGALDQHVRIEYAMSDTKWFLALRKFPDGDTGPRNHIQSLHTGTPWGGWVDIGLPPVTIYEVDCVVLARDEAVEDELPPGTAKTIIYALGEGEDDVPGLYIWVYKDPWSAEESAGWRMHPALVDPGDEVPEADRERMFWTVAPFGDEIAKQRHAPGGCPPLSRVVESWQV